ncbi:uncharacterized protein AMSG_05404 [Thecamonas trahens ATCC 50062]|uniref:Uncharacterized protein n=1 Tax=Thecamonas trahens ATCC 50062 TaxID=461836 RepID=A0A0L0DBA8_THETB|nr:hypothetical protein AMSG_05404 [Thecamonas trahens ATCC 50062]KNC49401.1 hypothetical protein AMSG_05404 [Thecamonas trahens ATCC 50062]|eukprot:XP_013757825.1 hypothetical protein AMSG_05404 [Thecamonas trahens ATCC 50062]
MADDVVAGAENALAADAQFAVVSDSPAAGNYDRECSSAGFVVPQPPRNSTADGADDNDEVECNCAPFRTGVTCAEDRPWGCSVERLNPLLACVPPSPELAALRVSDDPVCASFSVETVLDVEARVECAFLDGPLEVNNTLLAAFNYSVLVTDGPGEAPNTTVVIWAQPASLPWASLVLEHKVYNLNRLAASAQLQLAAIAPLASIGNVTLGFRLTIADIPPAYYAGGRLYTELRTRGDDVDGFVASSLQSVAPLIIDVKERTVGPTDDGEMAPALLGSLIALGVLGGIVLIVGGMYAYYLREAALAREIEAYRSEAAALKRPPL